MKLRLGFTSMSIIFLILDYAHSINTSSTEATMTFSTSNVTDFSMTSTYQDQEINDTEELPCNYAPGLSLGSKTRELECCRRIESRYEFFWAISSLPLNRYLATLRDWNCPHFQIECEERVFAFNMFTELMYDYFCDYNEFVFKCLPNVTETIIGVSQAHDKTLASQNFSTISTSEETLHWSTVSYDNSTMIAMWQDLLVQIQPAEMTIEELLQPCIQIAQYDQEEIHDGGYQEIIDFGIPSCKIAWCGFGAEAAETHHISVWTCLTSQCRTAIIAILVACGVLGLLIAFVNLMIILVIIFNKKFRNSQAIYKLSLAAADVLVGIFVLPLAVDVLRRLVWTRHLSEGHIEIQGYLIQNGIVSDNLTSIQFVERAGQFRTKFPLIYENVAGFFTAVSIFVSVYTLAGAGFDRVQAVYNPFSYRKEKANKLAKRLCIASWTIAILFGLLPLFTPNLAYALVLSITFVTLDFNGLILYSVGLFVPLLVIWVVNVFTFIFSKQHSNFRRQLTRIALKKRQRVETRLAHTLELMVAVFTVNTLPLIILIVSSLFLPSTRPNLPHQFNLKHGNLFIILEFVAVMMLFGNSLWNFFIYSYRNKDFRMAVKVGFGKVMKKICFSACVDSVVMCCQSVAHSSRRRLSTFGSFSRYSLKTRKKSLVTAITKISNIHIDDSELYDSSSYHTPKDDVSTSTQKNSNLPTAEDLSVVCDTTLSNKTRINGTAIQHAAFDSQTEVNTNNVNNDK